MHGYGGKRSSLFAFVSSSGTDPEAFLLIEARKIDENWVWTYQPARFTTREIWMTLKGTEIWRAAPVVTWFDGPTIDTPYFYRDVQSSELPKP